MYAFPEVPCSGDVFQKIPVSIHLRPSARLLCPQRILQRPWYPSRNTASYRQTQYAPVEDFLYFQASFPSVFSLPLQAPGVSLIYEYQLPHCARTHPILQSFC